MSFDDTLKSALITLSGHRADLLTHAVRAAEPRQPLRPLGCLCGATAIEHTALGGALRRLSPPGTGLTRAAVRHRRPIWIPSIDGAGAFARRGLLSHYEIRSGAALPVIVGQRVAAVIELLSFGRLQPEPPLENAINALMPHLERAAADPSVPMTG